MRKIRNITSQTHIHTQTTYMNAPASCVLLFVFFGRSYYTRVFRPRDAIVILILLSYIVFFG